MNSRPDLHRILKWLKCFRSWRKVNARLTIVDFVLGRGKQSRRVRKWHRAAERWMAKLTYADKQWLREHRNKK